MNGGARALALAVAVALLSHACRAPSASHARPTTIQSCEYDLTLSETGRAQVQAACAADGPIAFRLTSPSLQSSVESATPPLRDRFTAPDQRLSYQIDLARLAQTSGHSDRAQKVGDSFVGTLSTVLVVPEPLTTEIPVTVRVHAAPPLDVALGLRRGRAPSSYELMAHEIPVATYFAFGKLQQRTLTVAGGTLELSRLDGPLATSFTELCTWVEKSARAVADFYGAFPVPRASVLLVPRPSRDAVVFGKVLPESEPGIVIVIGEHAQRNALNSDWILIHELFHLGFPSLHGRGKWLDEGLATYYEPVIRARAGLYTEAQLWDELERRMPEGLPAFTERGLDHAGDFQGVYWGGAIASLVADVEARKRDPARGLEHGLRALREAGGTASEVWSLDDAVSVVDRALKAPILTSIARAHAKRGTPFDLARLFADLGVSRDSRGAIQLSNDAPLAAIRRAITQR